MKKDQLQIAKKKFNSRLIVGTGKYKNMLECAKAVKLSGAEIVTVAVRRVNIVNKKVGSNCFRLVCLANDYDQDILQKYSEIRKNAPPTDLILFNDKGFSMLEIM